MLTCMMVALWPCRVASALPPPRGSHSLMTLSLEADATTPLHGCQSQLFTSPPCPDSVASNVAVLKSQICSPNPCELP